MKKAKYSKHDTRGYLFVDCSECNRGGNGSDPDKCSSGHRIKTGNRGGCFIGTLIDGLVVDKGGEMSVGTIHPKGTMLLRQLIGSAKINDDGLTLDMSLVNFHTPCVESPRTGRFFTLSWSEIIDMAIAAGITNEAAE